MPEAEISSQQKEEEEVKNDNIEEKEIPPEAETSSQKEEEVKNDDIPEEEKVENANKDDDILPPPETEAVVVESEKQEVIEEIKTPTHDLDKLLRSQSSPSTVVISASDYEPLYTSLLEWLLNKAPASIEGSVMIDDTDQIKSINVVFIILRLFRQVPESVKQKMIQDLYMLIKCNLQNCELVLQYTEFQYFLLDTLYRYQISLYEAELQGDSIAIWEITTKTYILLIKHSLLNEPLGWKNLQKLFIWMENKRNLTANRFDSSKYEQAIYYLIRHIWMALLEGLEREFKNMANLNGSVIWDNLIQVIFYTKDFITSAYNASILSAVNAEFEAKNILQISNFIKKLSPNEPYPLSKRFC